ncbi:hypothetical protein V491_01291 [Pseudogymnoascus sp. VKM F-3775]|nr:hypothetical protein V491_01291 [Pseudogymnoascus sp. VKM F-3775]
MLLDHGADHEVEDGNKFTALDEAKHYQHSNVTKILSEMPISARPPTGYDPYNSDDYLYDSDKEDED